MVALHALKQKEPLGGGGEQNAQKTQQKQNPLHSSQKNQNKTNKPPQDSFWEGWGFLFVNPLFFSANPRCSEGGFWKPDITNDWCD